eukprot:TRINITY_DN4546_c0_g1_i1.p2 TRINITY_DN4546_c0_g1~~TRINITY_DN4546_c0_g1_i1.p2  ORF type:complete len:116 (-),score=65.94 TRINITY_DN4546_c0_g1_i1:340-663(-)
METQSEYVRDGTEAALKAMIHEKAGRIDYARFLFRLSAALLAKASTLPPSSPSPNDLSALLLSKSHEYLRHAASLVTPSSSSSSSSSSRTSETQDLMTEMSEEKREE